MKLDLLLWSELLSVCHRGGAVVSVSLSTVITVEGAVVNNISDAVEIVKFPYFYIIKI